MKHDLCVQGDSGAQRGAEHPKPLIDDERKRHETGITCPADTARLLLAYETLIYSSQRMLIPPIMQDYDSALHKSFVPINTLLKRVICTSFVFHSSWFARW